MKSFIYHIGRGNEQMKDKAYNTTIRHFMKWIYIYDVLTNNYSLQTHGNINIESYLCTPDKCESDIHSLLANAATR